MKIMTRALGSMLAGALVLTAAACGGAETEQAPAAPAEGFPVTVAHQYGETTIPAAPERIAAIGIGDQDALLALGVQPIMVPVWNGSTDTGVGEWAQDRLEGDPPVPLQAATVDFSLEDVAAAEPDLILAVNNAIDEDRYEQLSSIAPTVLHSGESEDWVLPWQEITRTVGIAVGQEDAAAELVGSTERLIEDTAAGHPEFQGRSGALVRVMDDGSFRVFSEESARGQLLAGLGIVQPTELESAYEGALFADIPAERWGDVDLDVLVVDNYEMHREALEANPAFTNLEVVRGGRVVELDPQVSDAVSMPGPLTIPFVLERFVAELGRAG